MESILRFLLLVVFSQISSLAFACEPEENCTSVNQWQLGVAFGVGVRTNPLVDGENIPLVILPDIAWYGESAYFDNGELGYQWIQDPQQAFSTFVHLDTERAFFSFWHPSNVFMPLRVEGNQDSGANVAELPDSPALSINAVASRDWAVNAGIRWHYYNQSGEWTLSAEQDISGVHQGGKLSLSYQHHMQWQDWKMSLKPALIWKSAQLINYYYGIDARDSVDEQFYYRATAGWQPSLTMSLQKPINEKWQWFFRASYQYLHPGMRHSPLVKQNNIQSAFFGLAYRF